MKRWNIEIDCYWEALMIFPPILSHQTPSLMEKKHPSLQKCLNWFFFFFLKYNRKFAHIGLHLNIAEHKNTSIESIHLQLYTEVVASFGSQWKKRERLKSLLAKTGMTLSNFISGAHTIFRIGMSLLSITVTLVTWKSLGTKQGRYFGRKFPRMAHLKICLQRLHH